MRGLTVVMVSAGWERGLVWGGEEYDCKLTFIFLFWLFFSFPFPSAAQLPYTSIYTGSSYRYQYLVPGAYIVLRSI